jgi:hypothetical protein
MDEILCPGVRREVRLGPDRGEAPGGCWWPRDEDEWKACLRQVESEMKAESAERKAAREQAAQAQGGASEEAGAQEIMAALWQPNNRGGPLGSQRSAGPLPPGSQTQAPGQGETQTQ